MNISKDVIRDLLPVYVAGEASADTRVLVEESLANDPCVRAEVAALGTVPVADVALPVALGISSLKRTQFLLRRRTFLVGFCYLFTTLPLALVDRAWGPVWLGVPAIRLLSTACIITAAVGWLAFVWNAKELSGTGLHPLRTRGPLMAWGFGCSWIAYSAAVVVNDWFPGHMGVYFCAFLLLTLVFWATGRKLRQFHTLFELDPPQTLFGDATGRDEM